MADFDPDKFLAKLDKPKNAGDFDPDKFLESVNAPRVINEMHPDISSLDRALVKNFGNDTNSSIEYLNKKYGGKLEFSKDKNGDILAKRPEENSYRKLDPSGLMNSLTNPAELARDLGDVGVDVASGVGNTLATLGGGLAGNLPGAVAAGAGSSAALEALRQKLGEYFGVNKGVSGSDVALSGAFGAASPLLLGSGASAAQAAKGAVNPIVSGVRAAGSTLNEYIPKNILTAPVRALIPETAGASEILAANKGLLGRAALPATEFMSGISKDVLKTAYDKMPQIMKMGENSIKSFSSNSRQKVASALGKAISDTGSEIGNTVKKIETPINVDSAVQPVKDLLAEFQNQASEIGSDASLESFDELKNFLSKYLSKKVPGSNAVEPIQNLGANNAWELAKSLETFAEAHKIGGIAPRHAAGASVADKRISNAALDVARNLRDQLDSASNGALTDLNSKYADLKGMQKELGTFLKDSKSTYRNLSNVLSPANRVAYETLDDIDKAYNTGIIDDAKLLAAYKQFSNAPWLNVSSQGTTSTSRTVPLSNALGSAGYYFGANSGLGQGGAGIGAAIGNILGMTVGSPKATKTYIEAVRNSRFLEDQARRLSGGLPVTKSAINAGWNAIKYNGGE